MGVDELGPPLTEAEWGLALMAGGWLTCPICRGPQRSERRGPVESRADRLSYPGPGPGP